MWMTPLPTHPGMVQFHGDTIQVEQTGIVLLGETPGWNCQIKYGWVAKLRSKCLNLWCYSDNLWIDIMFLVKCQLFTSYQSQLHRSGIIILGQFDWKLVLLKLLNFNSHPTFLKVDKYVRLFLWNWDFLLFPNFHKIGTTEIGDWNCSSFNSWNCHWTSVSSLVTGENCCFVTIIHIFNLVKIAKLTCDSFCHCLTAILSYSFLCGVGLLIVKCSHPTIFNLLD